MTGSTDTMDQLKMNLQNFNDEQLHNEANERYTNILNITGTPNKGYGLFALKDFDIGDLIMTSGRTAKITTTRCSHSVQIDWNKHILMDLPAILINHSCSANVGIHNNNTTTTITTYNSNNNNDEHATVGGYNFWAIRPIIKGEELTWDYEATEWELSTPFRCTCGSKNCRHILKGFKHNGDNIRKQYGEYYANYLKENNNNNKY
ncbi:SET domain-containing protein [Fragilariopsis cylindrus CCMP1102]|uniref:SET domain-containing protein n=1 Tax=Fragilariopsis cylindrus CCMP1102 TaxID=635003 RepID=A0A1E7FV68_9STRA|nr:SET domain-containing protein [Fragilariopsis cylindrus CCMP1102]|eukprot:OEU22042.1 SET domain-containing protein [Fragilariopsis cylindrus CCMP1102]